MYSKLKQEAYRDLAFAAGQKLNLQRKSSNSFHDKRYHIKVFEYLIECLFMMLKTFCLVACIVVV